jgi:hypothetical protein
MSYPSLCGFLSWAQYVCFVVCVGVRLLAEIEQIISSDFNPVRFLRL